MVVHPFRLALGVQEGILKKLCLSEEGRRPFVWEACEDDLWLKGSECDRQQLVQVNTGSYSSVVAHQRLGDS